MFMRILIIDDDEIFCRLLVEILEASDIQAIWTTDGLNGYEMLSHDDYDLCIIDVRMPLILGTERSRITRAAKESCSCPSPSPPTACSMQLNSPSANPLAAIRKDPTQDRRVADKPICSRLISLGPTKT
jgi:CheY-like chemotaxis protein